MTLSRIYRVVILLVACGAPIACSERRAIQTVQETHSGVLGENWKAMAETWATRSSGSNNEWTWTANQSQSGLKADEWLVSYTDKNGRGFFWLARPSNKEVTFLNSDDFASYQVGHLSVSDSAAVELSMNEASLLRCTDRGRGLVGWCYYLRGNAKSTKQSLTAARVDVRFQVKIDGQIHSGEQDEIGFGPVSERHAWAVGEERSFGFVSPIIPDVYATQPGRALLHFSVVTSAPGWTNLRETVFIKEIEWPPSLPPLDRPWSIPEFRSAAAIVVGHGIENPSTLPRWGGAQEAVFARMVSRDNFPEMNVPTLALSELLQKEASLGASLSPLIKAYGSEVDRNHRSFREFFDILFLAVSVSVDINTAIQQKGLETEKDLAFREKTLAARRVSCVQGLTELLDLWLRLSESVTPAEAESFANQLAQLVPRLPKLSAEQRQIVVSKLEKLSAKTQSNATRDQLLTLFRGEDLENDRPRQVNGEGGTADEHQAKVGKRVASQRRTR